MIDDYDSELLKGAYQRGYDARIAGQPVTDNPYTFTYHERDMDTESQCNDAWWDGWTDADDGSSLSLS